MSVKSVIRSMFAAYGTTTALLLLLAFLLFKFDLSENIVNAGITVIYIIAAFLGGFITGKQQKQQKYLWGALTGTIYFLLFLLVSLLLGGSASLEAGRFITIFCLCLGGGMLGGMFS